MVALAQHASEGLPNTHRLEGEHTGRQAASGPLTLPSFAYTLPQSPLSKGIRVSAEFSRPDTPGPAVDCAEPDR